MNEGMVTMSNSTPMKVDLHALMTQFRLASRELFNNYFHTGDHDDAAWAAQERFTTLEEHLFTAMVTTPADLPRCTYGFLQPEISVVLARGRFAPWLLNRELDSGYWDHPQSEVTDDAVLSFITFFDWDAVDFIDNRYVRVLVKAWPSHPELTGKHALIETIYVRFAHATDETQPGPVLVAPAAR